MGKLDLSVVILSYNTKDITSRCLDKLKIAKVFCENKFKNKIEVLVVDNGSEDGSAEFIKSEYKWVKLLALKENSGFSKGNNIAMKQSSNPFILLLNSDVYVEENSLYKALAYFRVNLNCDVLGARLDYSDGRLQPSAGSLPNPLNLIFWILRLGSSYHPKNEKYFSKAHQVGWIMGAFMMLKREIFNKTLGFDENIFMHMEEVEWCKRIKGSGYKIWYVPSIEVVHLHGASANFDLSSSFLNELKGVKYYLNKHYASFYWFVRLFLILGLILRVLTFSILKKKDRARIYMKGLKVV